MSCIQSTHSTALSSVLIIGHNDVCPKADARDRVALAPILPQFALPPPREGMHDIGWPGPPLLKVSFGAWTRH